MPKSKPSVEQKANIFVGKFPNEFILNSSKELFCKFCITAVKCDKEQNVEQHRKSKKHSSFLECSPKQPKLAAENESGEMLFSERVTNAFLAADIPLKKLQNPNLRQLFQSMNHPLPSESTCRNNVEKIHNKIINQVKNIIKNKKIFIIFDETTIGKNSYSHTLIGTVNNASQTYLVECEPLHQSLNAAKVCQMIDSTIKFFEIKRENFCLLLSDAARYMVSAGESLKIFYPDLFHVTCIAHLFHNCCLKIRSNFSNVDKIIATVKSATVRNRERRNLFKNIGYPPEPVLTRWGSWLKAAFYYAKNINEIEEIFKSIESNGKLIRNVKEALNDSNLRKDLKNIFSCYQSLSESVELSECESFTISQSSKILASLDFKEDPCQIRKYIDKRLEMNEIKHILEMKNVNITPETYSKLQECQATSCSVERTFSVLNKILAKDRNFKTCNIKYYVIVKCNSSLLQ